MIFLYIRLTNLLLLLMKKHLLFIFILSGFKLFAQLPSNVSPVGLVAWYGLNGNVNDASINGNHCTNYGATLTADRNGNANSAYAFDGVSNYLERTTPSYIFSQTGNFSFSIWVKKASANAGIMMMSGTGTSGVFIWLLQGNATGTSYFGTNMQQSAWIWSTCPYSLSQWEHYVGVYTGSNGLMKLYKNGVFQSSATYTYTSATASAIPLFIGKGISSNNFHGDLDDIGIWNRALTQCEITDLYAGTTTVLPVNAGLDQTICAGQSVTLTATGATTYTWNNWVVNNVAFTPNITKTYTVNGTDANGCKGSDQVVVTVNQPLINAGADQTICTGQQATLTATGATSYTWTSGITNSTPFTPTATQTYSVSGTDVNGCSGTDAVTVTLVAQPTVNAGQNISVCSGDSVQLNATGAATYTWSSGTPNGGYFTPAASQTLQVIGSAGGSCTDTDDLQITVNQGSASTQNISGLNSLTLNGQTYTTSGTYTQVIPNQAGCDSTITLNLTMNYTGIEENNSNFISIFPNPTTTNVVVTLPKEMIGQSYILVSATGKVLAYEIIKYATTTINLDQLAQGTYFLQIGTLKNPSKIVKL
jgi:hypothetical protein